MKVLILFALLVFIFLEPVYSNKLHVPTEYSSIQSAINASSDGDTILVSEGRYFENINFRGKAIVVASEFLLDGDTVHISQTIIDGSKPLHPDSASVVTFNSGEDSTSVLNGFTITGGKGSKIKMIPLNTTWITGGGVNILFCGGKVLNNIIKNNHISSSTINCNGGGISAIPNEYQLKTIILRKNNVYYNSIRSPTFVEGAGVLAGGGFGSTIVEKNHIHHNLANGLQSGYSHAGGLLLGILHPWNTNFIVRKNLIEHNEIYGKDPEGAGIYLTIPPPIETYKEKRPSILIYNNIIANNHSDFRAGGIGFTDQIRLGKNRKYPAVLLCNNTLVNNTAKQATGLFSYYTKVLAFNNIFWNSTEQVNGPEIQEISSGLEQNIRSNSELLFFYHNTIKGDFFGYTNSIENPDFNNESFSLSKQSFSIGRGADSIIMDGEIYYAPTIDYYGNNRKSISPDQKIDIGAIESPFEKWTQHFDGPHIINVPEEEPTIQAGIDAAKDGDTVLVDEGIYHEHVSIENKAITLASKRLFTQNNSYVNSTVLHGFTPSNNPDSVPRIITVNSGDKNVVLNGLTITGSESKWHWNSLGGGVSFIGKGRVEHNAIFNNHLFASLKDGGAGIYASGEVNISNNIIHQNELTKDAFSNALSIGGGGMHVSPMREKVVIESNQITNNSVLAQGSKSTGGGISAHLRQDQSTHLEIKNNLISENSITGDEGRGGGLFILQEDDGDEKNQNSIADIYNNLLLNNEADYQGGGIGVYRKQDGENNRYSFQPTVLVKNNTLLDNSAKKASGLWNFNSITLLLNNVLWSYNTGSEISQINSGNALVEPDTLKNGVLIPYRNIIKYVQPDENNYNENPGLDQKTYSPRQESFCTDRGLDSIVYNGIWYSAPNHDYLQKSRPFMGLILQRADIGAMESNFENPDATGSISHSFLEQNQAFIFPNPCSSKDIIHVKTSDMINTVRLYSLDYKPLNLHHNNNGEIQLPDLTPGLYILTLQDIEQKPYAIKLIIE